jgi:hypothetical protein
LLAVISGAGAGDGTGALAALGRVLSGIQPALDLLLVAVDGLEVVPGPVVDVQPDMGDDDALVVSCPAAFWTFTRLARPTNWMLGLRERKGRKTAATDSRGWPKPSPSICTWTMASNAELAQRCPRARRRPGRSGFTRARPGSRG